MGTPKRRSNKKRPPPKVPEPNPSRPPAVLNGADWKMSKAKLLISQDIIDGHIPGEGPIDVEALFEQYYKGHEFFANFPFDKIRYTGRIDRLRKAIVKLKVSADRDAEALQADLMIFPPPVANIRGELRWHGSEAERLLKLDIDAGVHLQPGYEPKKLHKASHGEYMKFKLTIFRKHIRQELTSRKTFDEKTLRKRCSGYKVGKFGKKELSRNNAVTNTAANA